ncbi:MAG TPA: rRNA maturation RNase YbeY [Vicinamibacterales bacterium]|nr:rRNA maturation RNase YbeY [Vicinamibacterales bacterium]
MPSTDRSRRRGLRVVVDDRSGRRAVGRALGGWLERLAPGRLRGAVTVALVSDARVRALNRRFRGVDRATDVLSFPGDGQGAPGRSAAAWPHPPAGEPPHLGDVVIAAGVAARQARRAGHSRLTELRVLALHGLLHLAGYDHERDDGRMARLERRLRRKGGLREGLIERTR